MYYDAVLIATETSHRSGTPHIVVSKSICSAEARELKYKDVVGFLVSKRDVGEKADVDEFMKKQVLQFKKNLICVIENDSGATASMHYRSNDNVLAREVQVYTNNDVNYDIWLDAESSFWNPVDFLLDGEYFEPHPMEIAGVESPALNENLELISEQLVELKEIVVHLARALIYNSELEVGADDHDEDEEDY